MIHFKELVCTVDLETGEVRRVGRAVTRSGRAVEFDVDFETWSDIAAAAAEARSAGTAPDSLSPPTAPPAPAPPPPSDRELLREGTSDTDESGIRQA